jgi:hexosaminidase
LRGVKIVFENIEDEFEEEGYELVIKPEIVNIRASQFMGFFYALISLLQMRVSYNDLIPCGKLDDRPRFSWRGQHLDCARHFYEVESILRLLDLMSFLKLNRFHWHLIDDEAFRLELSSFRNLAARTGMRGDDCTIPGVFGGGKGPTGGTYSVEDVARIIDHASSLGISVMPEIEIPAHSLALVKVIPEMRDSEDRSCEESVQGYAENTINPAMPATWEFLGKVIPEVCNLFPFGVIHLGCDELPRKIWQSSPAIEKLKEKEGLKSIEDVLEWTMKKAAKILVEAGGRPAAWEEAGTGQNGGIGNDALLFPGCRTPSCFNKYFRCFLHCPFQHIFDRFQTFFLFQFFNCW